MQMQEATLTYPIIENCLNSKICLVKVVLIVKNDESTHFWIFSRDNKYQRKSL